MGLENDSKRALTASLLHYRDGWWEGPSLEFSAFESQWRESKSKDSSQKRSPWSPPFECLFGLVAQYYHSTQEFIANTSRSPSSFPPFCCPIYKLSSSVAVNHTPFLQAKRPTRPSPFPACSCNTTYKTHSPTPKNLQRVLRFGRDDHMDLGRGREFWRCISLSSSDKGGGTCGIVQLLGGYSFEWRGEWMNGWMYGMTERECWQQLRSHHRLSRQSSLLHNQHETSIILA